MLLLLAACLVNTALYNERLAALADVDGDGVAAEGDCDDLDGAVFPGAAETCNGIDDDCDADIDEGYADVAETCNGVDDDCDGEVDDDASDATAWYADTDGDGFGASGTAATACEPPPGHVADSTDCDDANAGRFPENTEVPYDGIDQDCNGSDADDLDADGHPAVEAGGDDCDDADPLTFPGADETWARGFTDSDCDGELEEQTEEFGTDAWVGRSAGGQLGYRLGVATDLDGDGSNEILAAALFDGSVHAYGGSVSVLNGHPEGAVEVGTIIAAGGAGWFLGVSMDGREDVDGDGVSDLLLGADGYDGGEGSAWLVSGAAVTAGEDLSLPFDAIGVVTGSTASTYAGHSLAYLPDFTGDGEPWVAITTPYQPSGDELEVGAVALFPSSILGTSTIDDADINIVGYYPGGQFGLEVEAGDDQDGDGLFDFLARFAAGDIAVILPGGRSATSVPDDALWRVTGTGAGESAACSFVGDIDADGDLDIGCASGGLATLFTPSRVASVTTITEPTVTISMEPGGYANQLLNLGDLDADGADETLIASPYDTALGTSALGIAVADVLSFGGIYSYHDFRLRAEATVADALLGHRMVAPGDVDGDGLPDIAIGGPADDRGGIDAGAVVLMATPN